MLVCLAGSEHEINVAVVLVATRVTSSPGPSRGSKKASAGPSGLTL